MNAASLDKTLEDLSLELDAPFVSNFDPVRFAFIKSLSQRAGSQQHAGNSTLDGKARSVVQKYLADLRECRQQASRVVIEFDNDFPEQADAARKLFGQCEFGKLDSWLRQLKQQTPAVPQGHRDSLAALHDLTDDVNQQAEAGDGPEQTLSFNEMLNQQEQRERLACDYNPVDDQGDDKLIELQSMKKFLESIKSANVDKTINRAINETPKNPGPHNPQMLAIKSLSNMRDLSPHYLRRFAAYIEALLWLEKSAAKLSK